MYRISSPIRSRTSPTSAFDGHSSPGEISCTVRTPSSITVRWSGMLRRRRAAEPDRAEHVQVGHRRHQRAPRQLDLVPVEDVLGPLGRRRDAAHLIQRPALERGSSPAATRGRASPPARRSSRRRRTARHPRQWPRRPPVGGPGRRCRGSAPSRRTLPRAPWRDLARGLAAASSLGRGAARGWCPRRSSKPLSRRSPAVGRFDSCAAPLHRKLAPPAYGRRRSNVAVRFPARFLAALVVVIMGMRTPRGCERGVARAPERPDAARRPA